MAPEEHPETSSFPEREEDTSLPDWLKDISVESSPEAEDDLVWTADVDFSDLPGWLVPEAAGGVEKALLEESREGEEEGKGLLAGVRGPIPVEPIILLDHDVPPFPGSLPRKADSQVAPPPFFPAQAEVHTPPKSPSRVRALFRAFVVVLIFVAFILAAFTVMFVFLNVL